MLQWPQQGLETDIDLFCLLCADVMCKRDRDYELVQMTRQGIQRLSWQSWGEFSLSPCALSSCCQNLAPFCNFWLATFGWTDEPKNIWRHQTSISNQRYILDWNQNLVLPHNFYIANLLKKHTQESRNCKEKLNSGRSMVGGAGWEWVCVDCPLKDLGLNHNKTVNPWNFTPTQVNLLHLGFFPQL